MHRVSMHVFFAFQYSITVFQTGLLKSRFWKVLGCVTVDLLGFVIRITHVPSNDASVISRMMRLELYILEIWGVKVCELLQG